MGGCSVCNSSLVYNMSRACVVDIDQCDGGDDYGDMCDEVKAGKCYPYSDGFTIFVSCWCIFISVTGTFTNLLTLFAIPSAMKLKRFGIANISGGTTIFILNLAVADLSYSLINLPLYATTYLSHGWPLGQTFCVVYAAFRDANAYAEWMALAAIAFSRCASLICKDWAQKYLTGYRGVLLAVSTWIWAYAIFLCTYFGDNGMSGYDCVSARCESYQQTSSGTFNFADCCIMLASVIPFSIIVACYSLIAFHVKKTYKHLRHSLPICEKHKQEMSLTWMMCGVSLCFIICVGPITVWNVLDTSDMNPNIGLSLYCIYWIQYTLNFFIYALQSAQFRQAYKDFLNRFWSILRYGFKTDCMESASMSYQTVMRINLKIPQKPLNITPKNVESSAGESTPDCCSLCILVQEKQEANCSTN